MLVKLGEKFVAADCVMLIANCRYSTPSLDGEDHHTRVTLKDGSHFTCADDYVSVASRVECALREGRE